MRTEFDGTGDVLVVTGGANGISRAVADAPLDGTIRDRTLLDVGSRVEERFGCGPETILLIRPDGHIAALRPIGERSAEEMYQAVTGRPSTVEET